MCQVTMTGFCERVFPYVHIARLLEYTMPSFPPVPVRLSPMACILTTPHPISYINLSHLLLFLPAPSKCLQQYPPSKPSHSAPTPSISLNASSPSPQMAVMTGRSAKTLSKPRPPTPLSPTSSDVPSRTKQRVSSNPSPRSSQALSTSPSALGVTRTIVSALSVFPSHPS